MNITLEVLSPTDQSSVLFSKTVQTDYDGSYHIDFQSSRLTEESYPVRITPSRIDPVWFTQNVTGYSLLVPNSTVVLPPNKTTTTGPATVSNVVILSQTSVTNLSGDVTITVSIQSVRADYAHLLSQPGVPQRVSRLIKVQHNVALRDQDFTDASEVLVSGRILFQEQSWPLLSGCGIDGVTVSSYSLDSVNMTTGLPLSDAIAIHQSLPSDSSGYWSLDVGINSQFVLVPQLAGRTFAPFSLQQSGQQYTPASVVQTIGVNSVDGVDFQDFTRRTLSVSLVGGDLTQCNTTVGQVLPTLQLPSCPGARFTIKGMPYGLTPMDYQRLPALAMVFHSYSANQLDGFLLGNDQPTGDFRYTPTSHELALQATMNGWLLEHGLFYANLVDHDQQTVLNYIAPLELPSFSQVVSLPTVAECSSPIAAPAFEQPVNVSFGWLSQGSFYSMVLPSHETYGHARTQCFYTASFRQVSIIDQISNRKVSDGGGPSLRPCEAGCTLPAQYITLNNCSVSTSVSNATASTCVPRLVTVYVYNFIAGDPEIITHAAPPADESPSIFSPDYTRYLRYSVLGDDSTLAQLNFAIAGTTKVAEGILVEYPFKYVPQMILHDPPGGGSFATITTTYTNQRAFEVSSSEVDNYQISQYT